MGRYKPFQGMGGKRKADTSTEAIPQHELTIESDVTKDIQESSGKTAQVQGQVDEVKQIMQSNVDKTIQRGESLQNLEAQTSRLNEASSQFSTNAAKAKSNLRWKQMRRAIIISVVIIVVIAILAAVAAFMIKKKKNK